MDTALSLLKEFVEESPHWHDDEAMYHECLYCYASVPVHVEDHKPDCLWRRAKEFIASMTP